MQAIVGIANAYYDSGQTEKAIEYYKKAIQIDDEISDVYYNMANAYY
jgi:tetratricopeptide (TPR) repeat protein